MSENVNEADCRVQSFLNAQWRRITPLSPRSRNKIRQVGYISNALLK